MNHEVLFSLAEDSHEISRLIFFLKNYKKNMSAAAVLICALRVKKGDIDKKWHM